MTVPAWLEPELATLTHDRFSDPAWLYERKLDGERCLAFAAGGRVRLLTRNQLPITTTFPEVTEALAGQREQEFVADGEIVAFDGDLTSFSRLQQRLGISHPGPDLRRQVPVCYYLFDLLQAGGQDTRSLPLRERKRLLRERLSFRGPLRYTEDRTGDGEAYWEEACRNRWEGLIAKRASAPYRAGRSRDWLKFKCENAQEFVIGGYTDPQGSRTGFGALLLGYYEPDGSLAYAGKVGTGFDERTLRRLHAALSGLERDRPAFSRGKLPRTRVHWVEPRLVGQIAFTEWTRDGQLRHPRFQGLRDDKDPGDVVREVAQLSVVRLPVVRGMSEERGPGEPWFRARRPAAGDLRPWLAGRPAGKPGVMDEHKHNGRPGPVGSGNPRVTIGVPVLPDPAAGARA
jgi:DNA ligase D-like protein (predicted ligase)